MVLYLYARSKEDSVANVDMACFECCVAAYRLRAKRMLHILICKQPGIVGVVLAPRLNIREMSQMPG